MGIFDRFKIRGGAWLLGTDLGVQVANMSVAELYRSQPNLRAVVSFMADNAAQVPLKVHNRVSDADRPRVLDSPAAKLLAYPNADMTAYELRRSIYSDLLLFGRCLCLVLRDGDTPSGWQIRPVPPTWIRDYEGGTVFAPEYVEVGHPLSSETTRFDRGQFVIFHTYNPTDPAGQLSPVEALAESLFEQVESGKFRRQMWQRGGRFNAYITRPKDVAAWDDKAFSRFLETWKQSWAGDSATNGGGMPILEDGMEIKTVQFNAREAQWMEAKKLSREDVAAVYHINPALVWPGSGQTYASARDNARALYNDALAPLLMQVTDRIAHTLLPLVGEPEAHYVAYDITIKTEGTFEEKVAALSSATGAPFLTRNEARARLDMPAVDGGDELITPLNVLEGGLASAHDTAPDALSAEMECKEREPLMFKARTSEADEKELAEVFREFYEHQRDVLLPKLGAAEKSGTVKAGEWWNEQRWNDELTEKLKPVAQRQSDKKAAETIAALKVEDTYSTARTEAFIESMCRRRAEMVNAKTKKLLDEVGDWDEDSDHGSYRGVFDLSTGERSETGGSAFATAIAGWAALEAVRQCAPGRGATKTWVVTSSNPRESHEAMNGDTVPYDQTFSNGAMWPGDSSALDVADVANCQCVVDIVIP